MDKSFFKKRYYLIIGLIIILMLSLCIRLFVLTGIQEEKWSNAAQSQNTKEMVTSAPRGEILDRYGRVLAGNSQVFNVQINISGLTTEEINRTCYTLVTLFEKNGDEYKDNFPIEISDDNVYTYTYDTQKEKYLTDLGLEVTDEPEDVLNLLRVQYEIDEELDRYEAIEVLQQNYSVWPPISARSMTFTYDQKKEAFLSKYGLDEGLDAKSAFRALREKYSLYDFFGDDGKLLDDKECRNLFRIREEIKNTGYNKYRSSVIAEDVSDETVAYIEEMSDLLKGVEVVSETVRTYPNGSLASHILGYMGAISDSQYDTYVNQNGYSADDLIGKDGIEASMEEYLHGTDGIKTILVNSSGDLIETISESEPEAGKDVYLTIDMDLQAKAEDTLERLIKAVSKGGTFKSQYGNKKTEKYSNCKSGAIVCLDVETGEILAMASYPDYDPNIFAQGISTEDWASVQSTNPRDYLAPTPLYNNAVRASVQPGSTFKPVTAIAALECGLNPSTQITDKGYIKISDRTFGCSAWNEYRGTHGVETLVTGIQNSCNYFFYCIATGKNWGTGASLGYKEEISIEKIMSVASEFGLGEKTGVELYETITPLASAQRKLSTVENTLYYALKNSADDYWPQDTYDDEKMLDEEINTIVSWTGENPERYEIIERLKSLTTVREAKIEALADLLKYTYFNMAQWTVGDVFNISIGQGDNAYTPLQLARYFATLGNDGLRNEATIIRGIEDTEYQRQNETYQVDVDQSDINTVLEGLRRVVKYGTLASVFNGFPIEVCGKTGTAEKDGYINPKNEVEYIKKYLSKITDDVTWSQVKSRMEVLMEKYPDKYPTENDAVDQALIDASKDKVTMSMINKYKDTYDSFAWTATLAPYDDPKICVVTLLIQGGTSYNAAIANREMIGAYLDVEAKDYSLDFSTRMN